MLIDVRRSDKKKTDPAIVVHMWMFALNRLIFARRIADMNHKYDFWLDLGSILGAAGLRSSYSVSPGTVMPVHIDHRRSHLRSVSRSTAGRPFFFIRREIKRENSSRFRYRSALNWTGGLAFGQTESQFWKI